MEYELIYPNNFDDAQTQTNELEPNEFIEFMEESGILKIYEMYIKKICLQDGKHLDLH